MGRPRVSSRLSRWGSTLKRDVAAARKAKMESQDKIDLSRDEDVIRQIVRTPRDVSVAGPDALPPPEISESDLSFLAQYRRNEDLEKLRAHVIRIWRSAMTHYAYRCIAELTFLYPRIATNPVYASVLQTRMSTPNDVSLPFLDLGTCFGNDLRKLSLDGYPESDLFGLDVDEQFWKLGLELYDSPIHGDRVEEGAAGSKLTYLLGDILDDTFLTPDTSETSATESLPFPITRNYSPRNIDHLKGHFRFIHAGSLLHLFTKSTVPLLLRKTLSLLQPGGLYFGRTVGIPGDGVEGTDMRKEGVFGKESQLGYLHTRHSLANAFRDAGFVDVKVEAMPSKAGAGHKNGGGKPAEGSGVVLTFLLFEGRRAGSTE